MEIVVKSRNVEVPDHFRQLVDAKLRKLVGKFDHKVIRIEVGLLHEQNRRQREHSQRVELTCYTKGPVVRAEASNKDFTGAFEAANEKLGARLRKAADQRRVHRGRRTPESLRHTAPVPAAVGAAGGNGVKPAVEYNEDVDPFEGQVEEHLPGRIVREKEHSGEPMTVDDALFHMEMVGHDFYLFCDKDSGRPSVVYRRRGFDYGLLRLQM